ncbi:hypothetical protein EX30DRAFT_310712 [Ascodesmis nigricans]|uniref:Uncharacterized protein n=1 Tax=Ascodesmis nigricans TaxID=341454 RepID=A0A4S2MLP9_9PEZI|nr:hypothetical protein EX30DRAFT_310712 [Ascodesmis nigricans]
MRKAKPPQLVRPIGVVQPPQPGENSGVDARSWAERKHDLVDYTKHKDRRQKILEEMSKPYFRDFSRLSSQFKGKSWMAPSLLFRADKALHFPNLVGRTLENIAPENSTTSILFGNVSVVGVFSSTWAENQVSTFLDNLVEEALDQAPPLTPDDPDWVESSERPRQRAQRVDINVEENPIKAWLVRAFFPRLQRQLPEIRWSRYFLVERGFTEELKQQVGFWNQKVGYVYLVDWNCRIRWAGSGNAEPEEREALLRGLKKLVEDHRKVRVAMKAAEGEETTTGKPAAVEAKKEDPDDLI